MEALGQVPHEGIFHVARVVQRVRHLGEVGDIGAAGGMVDCIERPLVMPRSGSEPRFEPEPL